MQDKLPATLSKPLPHQPWFLQEIMAIWRAQSFAIDFHRFARKPPALTSIHTIHWHLEKTSQSLLLLTPNPKTPLSVSCTHPNSSYSDS